MTKFIYTISLIVLPLFSFSQKLITEISASPLITFMISEDTNNKVSPGFSISVNEFYSINENLSVGLGIIYSFEEFELTRDSEVPIYGSTYKYESEINIRSLTFPILINYKIKDKLFFRTGFGFIIQSYSHRSFQRINMFGDNGLDIETPWTRYNFEIGKYFSLGKINLVITASFASTFQNYEYNHFGKEYYDNNSYNYKLKPTNLGLSLGIVL